MQQRKNSNVFLIFFGDAILFYATQRFCSVSACWLSLQCLVFYPSSHIWLTKLYRMERFFAKNMEFWLTIRFWADFDIYWKVSDLNSDNIFGKMTLTNFHTQETKERWCIKEQRMKWLPDLLALLIKCTKKTLVGLTTQCVHAT